MSRNNGIDAVWVRGDPLVEKCIGFVAASRVISGACRVLEAHSLHARPETTHEEFGDGCPKSETTGVGLVAVPHEDVVVEKGGSIDDDTGEQSFEVGGVALPFQVGGVALPFQVVVSIDFDVAGLFRVRVVELGQLFIDGRMGNVNLVKGSVFPQFLRVTQFNVGEAVFQVIAEGAFVYEGIVGKVVRTGAVPAVHVTH